MKADSHDDSKGTALSHSSPAETNEEDDIASMLKGMKKKKPKKPKAEEGEGEAADEAAADGGLDLSSMKKKKKSKKPKEGTEDEFAARLAELEIEGKEAEEGSSAAVEKKPADETDHGDMEKGTGIWQHDENKPIKYELLLSRFFTLLAQKNPDHASSGSRSYKIPPPQCLREGNKKTIFANIAEICKRMKRTDEHVTSYLFAELGTSGSVDGSRRLVIKGRFQQKQIENVLRRYISKFHSFSQNLPANANNNQWNMSPARPADRLTPNSTRVKTDCTSSLATPAAPDEVLLQSRPVSLPKSAREEDSKVRAWFVGCMAGLCS